MPAIQGLETQELEQVDCNYCSSSRTRVVYDFSPLAIVQCRECGLVYTNPRLSLRSVEQNLYSADYWKNYERAIEEDLPAIQRFYRCWLDKLESRANVDRWNVCEVGPGLGVFLAEAKSRGHAVFGIELSEYAREYAKTRFGIDSIHRGTIDDLDQSALPKMDVFIMMASIEHLQDPLATLSKVNSLLSDSGLLLLSTGVWGCFNQVVAGTGWGIIAPEAHLYYFSKRAIRLFLEKAGFAVETLETNGALVNTVTNNAWLVKLFNNRLTTRLRLSPVVQRYRLGDEMFIIARKVNKPVGAAVREQLP